MAFALPPERKTNSPLVDKKTKTSRRKTSSGTGPLQLTVSFSDCETTFDPYKMAAAVLCSTLALVVTKAFLLADALFQPGSLGGVVAHVTQSFRVASPPRHTIVSQPSQRSITGDSIKVG